MTLLQIVEEIGLLVSKEHPRKFMPASFAGARFRVFAVSPEDPKCIIDCHDARVALPWRSFPDTFADPIDGLFSFPEMAF